MSLPLFQFPQSSYCPPSFSSHFPTRKRKKKDVGEEQEEEEEEEKEKEEKEMTISSLRALGPQLAILACSIPSEKKETESQKRARRVKNSISKQSVVSCFYVNQIVDAFLDNGPSREEAIFFAFHGHPSRPKGRRFLTRFFHLWTMRESSRWDFATLQRRALLFSIAMKLKVAEIQVRNKILHPFLDSPVKKLKLSWFPEQSAEELVEEEEEEQEQEEEEEEEEEEMQQ